MDTVTKVVKHGIHWLCNNSLLRCPECNSISTSYGNTRDLYDYPTCSYEHDKRLIGCYADCSCNDCKCSFTVERLFDE